MGSAEHVHFNCQKYVFDTSQMTSISNLQQRCKGVQLISLLVIAVICFPLDIRLVACTVLAASKDTLIREFDLDFCVMDEAGQITQPAALGAIILTRRFVIYSLCFFSILSLCTDRFVLVGDDHQLPPLVISKQAQQGGISRPFNGLVTM